jgi:hypothetical protein
MWCCDHEPTANIQQLSANSQQPKANNQQSTTKNQRPMMHWIIMFGEVVTHDGV